jgi:hypothetical protein
MTKRKKGVTIEQIRKMAERSNGRIWRFRVGTKIMDTGVVPAPWNGSVSEVVHIESDKSFRRFVKPTAQEDRFVECPIGKVERIWKESARASFSHYQAGKAPLTLDAHKEMMERAEAEAFELLISEMVDGLFGIK